jgi:NDP-sugar pyrophosphorylase family protein
MKAMILAAGEGTRLRPLTSAVPKPMVPVADTPLLTRTITLLAEQNVRDVAVNLFHRAEVIENALGDGAALGVALRYSSETTLLGTAGGVKRMEPFLDETFLVVYGDNLWQADFAPLVAFHRGKNALATIATFRTPNPSACGLVVTDGGGRVTRFQEKPRPEEVFTDTANAGVYVLEPEVLRHIPDGAVSDFGKDVFPSLLSVGKIFACPLNGYLQDTGTPESYRQANWDVLSGATGAAAAAPGGVLLGDGARVAGTARLSGRNVIGRNGVVGAGAFLSETIMWGDCHVGDGARVTGAVLGHGVRVGDGAEVGDGALLADGARVTAGARVPPAARVGPGETIS